jgi:hypothetical protein
VSNLRAAGFPEPILRNIVIAEIDQLFAARTVRTAPDTNDWRSGPERDDAEREQLQAERLVEAEKRAHFKEILGADWPETASARGEGYLLLILMLFPEDAPADKAERLSSLWAKIQHQSRELKSPPGLVTPELEGRRKQVYDEAMTELRRELGPAGFEELELRTLAMEVTDVWGSERLFGCVMSGEEFKELLRIKKEAAPPLRSLFDVPPRATTPQETQREDERLKLLLGAERFGGYQRAKDPQFRWVRRSMDKDDPMELTWGVFDIYAQTQAASRAVRDEASVPAEELSARLTQLRAAAERDLANTMGQEKFATFLERNRGSIGWLDQLTGKADQ